MRGGMQEKMEVEIKSFGVESAEDVGCHLASTSFWLQLPSQKQHRHPFERHHHTLASLKFSLAFVDSLSIH